MRDDTFSVSGSMPPSFPSIASARSSSVARVARFQCTLAAPFRVAMSWLVSGGTPVVETSGWGSWHTSKLSRSDQRWNTLGRKARRDLHDVADVRGAVDLAARGDRRDVQREMRARRRAVVVVGISKCGTCDAEPQRAYVRVEHPRERVTICRREVGVTPHTCVSTADAADQDDRGEHCDEAEACAHGAEATGRGQGGLSALPIARTPARRTQPRRSVLLPSRRQRVVHHRGMSNRCEPPRSPR